MSEFQDNASVASGLSMSSHTAISNVAPSENSIPDDSEHDHDHDHQGDAMTLRQRIHKTFEDPLSNVYGKIWGFITVICLFAFLISFTLESLPMYWLERPEGLEVIDWVSVAVFTIDYLARLLTCSHPIRFVFLNLLNVIDLLSFVPFYAEQISVAAGVEPGFISILRIFRFLQILRVIKLEKQWASMRVVVDTFKMSADAFLLIFALLFMVMTISSSALFYAEQTGEYFDPVSQLWIRTNDGSVSPFQSIVHCFWWSIVTLTTVGYGDTFPVTVFGKIVAGMTGLTGVLVLAFPIAILSSKFNIALQLDQERQEREKLLNKQRQLRLKDAANRIRRFATGGKPEAQELIRDKVSKMKISQLTKRVDELRSAIKNQQESITSNNKSFEKNYAELMELVPVILDKMIDIESHHRNDPTGPRKIYKPLVESTSSPTSDRNEPTPHEGHGNSTITLPNNSARSSRASERMVSFADSPTPPVRRSMDVRRSLDKQTTPQTQLPTQTQQQQIISQSSQALQSQQSQLLSPNQLSNPTKSPPSSPKLPPSSPKLPQKSNELEMSSISLRRRSARQEMNLDREDDDQKAQQKQTQPQSPTQTQTSQTTPAKKQTRKSLSVGLENDGKTEKGESTTNTDNWSEEGLKSPHEDARPSLKQQVSKLKLEQEKLEKERVEELSSQIHARKHHKHHFQLDSTKPKQKKKKRTSNNNNNELEEEENNEEEKEEREEEDIPKTNNNNNNNNNKKQKSRIHHHNMPHSHPDQEQHQS